ncbi:MAG: 16S rRNA (uracil(1498)-N(3))-methyltransferase [Nitrosomonas sp.]|jgi:16S rRNA (uracil1498-N3)-methyltransferase|nr:16S rRNA (uracil(1498)-N(3))-methyltransferase [Nitrosomonas sp.]
MSPRFYHADDIFVGQTIELNLAAGHHASRVLRLKIGDLVIVFNGRGGEFQAHIKNIRKTSTTLIVDRFDGIERESPLIITLTQALCANDRMDWIIQKSVELGITRIQPIITTRSIVRLSDERAAKRLEHWQKIIISACEQCGRNRIPTIALPHSLIDWLSARESDTLQQRYFMLSINGSHSLKNFPPPPADTQLTLAVGPEGGWTADEDIILQQAGFTTLRAGRRIMRTETAALATIAALQAYWGDF